MVCDPDTLDGWMVYGLDGYPDPDPNPDPGNWMDKGFYGLDGWLW
jgi:hypothetical protein